MKAHNFEIYLCNPETGETGWEIEIVTIYGNNTVNEAREALKTVVPNFDTVILFNEEFDVDMANLSAEDFQAIERGYKFEIL